MSTASNPRFPGRASLAALLVVVAVSAACESPTISKPGSRQLDLVPDSLVAGEIRQAGDTVVYSVRDTTARPWRIQLRAASGSAADTLVAELTDLNAGRTLVQVRSAGTDAAPEGQLSEWVVPSPGGRYQLRVRGQNAAARGAYHLRLQSLGPTPESLPRRVALRDTIAGEAIDRTGDVDEFSLAATPGQEVIVFFQALRPHLLWLVVVDSLSGEEIGQVASTGEGTFLEEQSTGRIVLPRAGPYLLRVQHSAFDAVPAGGVPYRFQIQPVNRAPESAPARLALGDTSAFETIGHVGDLDEFHFTGTQGQEVVLFAQLAQEVKDGLHFELLHGEVPLAELTATRALPALDSLMTGRVALPATGSYSLRVAGPAAGAPPEATGRYRVELYPVDPRPERAPAVAEIGALVTGEEIDRGGDVDEFRFTGSAGQEVNVLLSASGGPLELLLLDPSGAPLGRAISPHVSDNPIGLPQAGPGTTARLRLPASGEYRIRIGSHASQPGAVGRYEWRVHPIRRAPESRGATIAVGDTIRGEAIAPAGDIDTFRFQATEGQEINVFLRVPLQSQGMIDLRVGLEGEPSDPRMLGWRSWGGRTLDGQSTGRLTIPETGWYEVEIAGSMGMGTPVGQGPYELLVFPIARAPERVPPEIAVGDTVGGEEIYPVGDIDEFTFSATAGERLTLHLHVAPGPLYAFLLEVVDPRTDQVIFAVQDDRNGADSTLRTFTVPFTGTYLARVRALAGGFLHPNEKGAYTFSITRR